MLLKYRTMATFLSPKNPHKYECLKCNYFTSSLKDYNKHINTIKHNNGLTATIGNTSATQKILTCEYCNKNYMTRSGLWRHKTKGNCINTMIQSESTNKHKNELSDKNKNEISELTELVKDIIKQNIDVINQNKDLTNKIVDICKINQPLNTIANNNVNSNNTFNLNFFLNETCKNAMNISDFVDSIKIQISDLERVGEKGFVEGISDVVLNNLGELNSQQRPIHCSDQKRETLYIKDNDEWIKDDEPNTKMRTIIKQIAQKNIKVIPEWVNQHPNCCLSTSKSNDKYLRIVSNSMSGGSELEQKTNISKIISKIAKGVTIDKNKFQIK